MLLSGAGETVETFSLGNSRLNNQDLQISEELSHERKRCIRRQEQAQQVEVIDYDLCSCLEHQDCFPVQTAGWASPSLLELKQFLKK